MNDVGRIKALIYLQPGIDSRELRNITGFNKDRAANALTCLRINGDIRQERQKMGTPSKWFPAFNAVLHQAQTEFLYRKRAA